MARSKTPLRQLRSRGNEFHIGTLLLFSRWLDEMLHGVIPYESSNCFSVYTPLYAAGETTGGGGWKRRHKKGGAKLRLAKVPSLTKIQSMDSLQSGSFETYLNYIDDTVSHIRSQTFRFLVGVIGEEHHWPEWGHKNRLNKNVAGDCGSEKHPPFFGGPQQNVQKPKSQLFIISPISVHQSDFFWWEGWSWVLLSWKCFFYMTICSHV